MWTAGFKEINIFDNPPVCCSTILMTDYKKELGLNCVMMVTMMPGLKYIMRRNRSVVRDYIHVGIEQNSQKIHE